jgi:hypothetical protein
MEFLLWLLVVLAVVIPLWRIFMRAGLTGPLSLLVLVPGVGLLIVSAILAYADWPNVRGERLHAEER